ncbi:MFS transporter [Wenjunlia vitaminophila]|uniref:MFS transporter n=1 Tax=Wenjunlia vitaminophila TaxID=76728 RepID=A0A0T6LXZ7_WENVI|nr:MFS transporter [Wenjunlia vitaminophila]
MGHVVFITAAAAMGGFLFGYDSAVINGAVTGIQEHFQVGSGATGLVVSSALLGCAGGAATAGRLADRIGRVQSMRVASVLFTASAIGSMFPFGIWDLGCWRVIGGLGIGMASVIAPAYIAEVAPTAYRGRLGSFQQLGIVVGIVISQLANYTIAQTAGGKTTNHVLGIQAWQWMLGVMAVPAVLYGVLSVAIPESPRHLVAVGREEQARKVLAEVEGSRVDLTARIREIRESLRREHKPAFSDLLGGGRFRLLPVVWIGIGLSVFQQFVGINVIFYYSSALWQSVGINVEKSLLISLSTSIINLLGTFIAIALVDRVGRRPLAMVGSVGMTAALATAAWAFSFKSGTGNNITIPNTQGAVALVAAHAFVFFFALSWGVVVWVFLGEMFPNRIRGAALGVAASAQWIANWAITVSFPALSDWNLSTTYAAYSVFALVSLVFVWKLVPETKGKKLEEMDEVPETKGIAAPGIDTAPQPGGATSKGIDEAPGT